MYAFVVGNPRSGTTLLSSMLARHPQIAVPPETSFFRRTYSHALRMIFLGFTRTRRIQLLAEAYKGNIRIRDAGISFEEIEPTLRESGASFRNLLRGFLEAVSREYKCSMVIEKTPAHLENIFQLKRWFPNAKFVHIARDGRDVVESLTAVEWTHDNRLRHAVHWRWCMNKAERFRRRYPDHILTIRYEDMVRDPAATLEHLCRWLGVPFSSQMLDPSVQVSLVPKWERGWKSESLAMPDISKLERWRRLKLADLAPVEHLIHSRLVAFGYEVKTTRSERKCCVRWTQKIRYSSLFYAIELYLRRALRFLTPRRRYFGESRAC